MRLGAAAALVDGSLVPGDVEVHDGRVTAIGVPAPAGSGVVVPGLVDLQVNGVGGIDLRSARTGQWADAAAALAAGGATAVQPTFHSQSVAAYERCLGELAEVLAAPPPGCRLLPAHLEGPFLSPRWAGAHDPAHLLEPDPVVLDRLLGAGPVGFVTLAPELDGAPELVERLVSRGVVVSLGHSDADAAAAAQAFGRGIRHVTHCWNAHRRMSARDPGPAGAALVHPEVVIGLVGDLVHVAAEVVQLTFAAAPGRVAVTGDPVAVGAGTAAQESGGVARSVGGTIAGGLASPATCLRNLVGLGIPLALAVEACGGVQRRLLGLAPVRLQPGDPADLVVLDDSFEVRRTLVGGRECWRA